jgi:DNA-binding transcriptional LysR family regulator
MNRPLNLRQLQHAVLLADELHFARAAERAFLSQPAFSRSIAALEVAAGMRLFDRGPGFVQTTTAGECVIARARRLLATSADLTHELALLRTGELGDVAAGAGPFSAAMLLAPALADMQQRHPRVHVRLDVSHTQVLLEQLQDEALAFFVSDTRELPAGTAWQVEPLGIGSGGLFCRAAHPLARRRDLTLADLKQAPFASVRLPAPLRQRLSGLIKFDDPGGFDVTLQCESVAALLEYTLQSDAVLIAPEPLLREHLAAGRLVELKVPRLAGSGRRGPLTMELGLVWLRERTPTMSARILMDLVRERASRVLSPAAAQGKTPALAQSRRPRAAPRNARRVR